MTSCGRLARKPNPEPPDWIIGYTTRDHLCLDLDNTSLSKVLRLVQILMQEYPHVGDAVILGSSTRKLFFKVTHPPFSTPQLRVGRNCYHVVFDNYIPYEESCVIIETLAHIGVLNEEYVRIREMRNDMTLRVTKSVLMDETKPAPVPLLIVCNPLSARHDGALAEYFRFLWAASRL